MTGMGRTLVDEMVKVVSDNHGTAPPCREPKYRPLHYGRAGCLPHSPTWSRLPAEMQHGKGGMDSWPQICTGGYPWKACRKPSENQTQLDPRGARHRPPPSPRAPPSLRPARRPRRAAARAARRLSRPLVRARGVLACPRQVGLSGIRKGVAWMAPYHGCLRGA